MHSQVEGTSPAYLQVTEAKKQEEQHKHQVPAYRRPKLLTENEKRYKLPCAKSIGRVLQLFLQK